MLLSFLSVSNLLSSDYVERHFDEEGRPSQNMVGLWCSDIGVQYDGIVSLVSKHE